jgi:cytoskeletal protein RodZ
MSDSKSTAPPDKFIGTQHQDEVKSASEEAGSSPEDRRGSYGRPKAKDRGWAIVFLLVTVAYLGLSGLINYQAMTAQGQGEAGSTATEGPVGM